MLPLWLHIAIVVLLTVYFLFRFIKDHHFYELLFVIWVPSTLLTYLSDDKTFLTYVGIAQIVLFLLVIYFMFRKRGERRQKTLSLLAEMAADGMPQAPAQAEEDEQDDETEDTKE